MSTVDIDSKNIRIGMLRQWLNEERIKDAKYFVTNEELEVWLAPAFAHQRTHLKAELLAKIESLPVYDRSLFRDGYTDDPKDRRDMLERTPVIKILEEL
jgi:hypothetical protein